MGNLWNSTLSRKKSLTRKPWSSLDRKRIPRVGRRGKRLRKAGLVDGSLCTFIRGRACDVPDCTRAGQPHHVDHGTVRVDWWVTERDAEGLATAMEGRVCCLCGKHHRLYHDVEGNAAGFLAATDCYTYLAAYRWSNRFKRERPDEYRRILEVA